MLVHVCQRWRYLAFTSPHHLKLQLLCKLPRQSVKEMLDIWPESLFNIQAIGHFKIKKEIDDCVAALGINHRMSGIHLEMTSFSAFKTFVSQMQRPFPALTHLKVQPAYSIAYGFKDEISRSFLGGSAPSL